jgi:DNA repair protein RecO (recombination protein O)
MTTLFSGIVLGHQMVGEYDLIVNLYTREKGKISLLAKGMRRPGSKMRGAMEILNAVTCMAASGKRGWRLAGVVCQNSWPRVRKDYFYTVLGLSLAEAIDKCIELEEPDERIYNLLFEWLEFWENYTHALLVAKADLTAHFVLLHLFTNLGYGPEVMRCTQCGSQLLPGKHWFSLSAGGSHCEQCHSEYDILVSITAMKVLRWYVQKQDTTPILWKKMLQLSLQPKELAELVYIIKTFGEYATGKRFYALNFLSYT